MRSTLGRAALNDDKLRATMAKKAAENQKKMQKLESSLREVEEHFDTKGPDDEFLKQVRKKQALRRGEDAESFVERPTLPP
jgi:hypothetical protein